ncbi:dihydrolipoyl dehydrogenase family protein [Yinghuangia seranimata]|uniref:dihydrolipoyl dehydrogenase family protein n=1 Tax=Yinghuangia seranimata TaxID=408067 RepID=UPI00248D1E63|nr:NAD(P)/FAD-dependent oxidoreductase [Yinghuangia seranimata]MDI2125771.1 NAD(P)/FAD-dependent oxidoreductase [Yinghuangia seranimata]
MSTEQQQTGADPAEEWFDVVVVGAGPVGENVADRVRAGGLTVAVVEQELVGGECSYWACMPSKALLRPVQAVADVRRVRGAREAVTGRLDTAEVVARRNAVVGDWDDSGAAGWLTGIGAELVRGHGRLAGPRRVVVSPSDGGPERRLAARHAVAMATGSDPVLPPLPGMAEARPWTSRDATSAKAAPARLAVVGGGVVGVEMATAWQALGSSVTLLVRGGGLLPNMEPFAGELVADGLREAGVDVRFGVSATRLARPAADGPVTLTLDDGSTLEADEVLFATGRKPRTGDLGLDTVGLTPGAWLDTDDTLRVTDVEDGWLYAVGDVNHRALLTHQGKYQARIAGSVIVARARDEWQDTLPWGAHAATADVHAVPQVVFTDPEATAVGLSTEQAERAGMRVRAVDYDMGSVAGAYLYADEYKGRARMVVDLDRGRLVGATFVGPGTAELLHAATIAIAGEVPIDRLWHAVPAYPTISEVWLRLLEAYRG